jgi:hypothetical protein
MSKNDFKAVCDELDLTRAILADTNEVLDRIVESLEATIEDCEEALEEGLTDGSDQIFEGRLEFAESLLENIRKWEGKDE